MRYRLQHSLHREWLTALISLTIGALALLFSFTGISRTWWEPTAATKNAASVQPLAPATAIVGEADVIAAFDCARSKQALPAYQRDAQLDREAQRMLAQLLATPGAQLTDNTNSYKLTGQLLLDATLGQQGCAVGGFDVARIKDLQKASRIGAAVAAVPADTQPPLVMAVVLGR